MRNGGVQQQINDPLDSAPTTLPTMVDLDVPITSSLLEKILNKVTEETGAQLHFHVSGANAIVNVRLRSDATTSKIIDSSSGSTGLKALGNRSKALNSGTVKASQNGDSNLSDLAKELATLRIAMRNTGELAEHDQSIGRIADAEVAATQGNHSKVRSNLKKAGSWALDTAQKIGVSVAEAAIKKAMGMK